ncbi:MAG TPA: hypothetical protein DDZ81_26660 [Acetobacteraceae bacterium]|jgi:hypothetical protein|nr:hypothetical protein [Acetobacteraceae bacterium]
MAKLAAADVIIVTWLARSMRDLVETLGTIDVRKDGLGFLGHVSRHHNAVRPPKLTAQQANEALSRRDAGEPMCDIASSYNVSYSTIARLTA